jgi:alanine racemase
MMVDSFVEVKLAKDDDFLKVKETLSRIGIASRKEKKLWQSCHILHKKGKFYIVHFKELFALDHKETDFTEDDVSRRNAIVKLLLEWQLVTLANNVSLEPSIPINKLKILSFKEKNEWELIPKYNIGKTRY